MRPYELVLDDELLAFFLKIRSGKISIDKIDNEKLINFFKFYRLHLTNSKQLARLVSNNAVDKITASRLVPMLASQKGYLNLELQELLNHTSLRVILTEDEERTEPYYININNSMFDSHYVVTKKAREPRTEIHQWLRHIFLKAKHIAIYDPYILNNTNSFENLLALLPRECSIYCNQLCSKQSYVTKIKNDNPRFTIKKDRVYVSPSLHDRYIRVDNKLEIILSSGIDYLFELDKEITCILRCVK